MEANPAYFRGAPKIQHLTLLIIPDDNTTEAQLRSHEADLGLEITAPAYRDLADAPGVTRQLSQAPSFTALIFNVKRPPLTDDRVRRALVMGIDRAAIVRDNTYGTGLAGGRRSPALLLGVRFVAAPDSLRPVRGQVVAERIRLASLVPTACASVTGNGFHSC